MSSRSANLVSAGMRPSPLPPQDAAQLVPYPSIPLVQRAFRFSQLEVRCPTAQHRIESLNRGAEVTTARIAQQRFHFRRQLPKARPGNAQFRSHVPREAIAQKLSLPRPRHRTLRPINFELESLGQKSGQTLQQPHARSFAGDINLAVV